MKTIRVKKKPSSLLVVFLVKTHYIPPPLCGKHVVEPSSLLVAVALCKSTQANRARAYAHE